MERKASPAYVTERDIFAQRLTETMKERGENQTTLAAKLTVQYGAVQRQTISLYMNGQSKPDAERVAAIAKVLGVSSDYLLGLSDTQTPFMDLRAVHEYTGLSDASIKFLHTMHSVLGSDMFARVIDVLIRDAAVKDSTSDYNSLLWLLNFFLNLDASGGKRAYTMDASGEIRPFTENSIPSSRIAFDGSIMEDVALGEINRRLIALKRERQAAEAGDDGKR